jgi:hypothetical protein
LDASDVASSIAGFFVEADASAGVVTVEAVAIASNAARDTDGDEIPDVLDSCPLDAMVAPLAFDCDSDPSGTGGGGPDDAGTPASDGGARTLLDAGAPSDAGQAVPNVDAGNLGGSAGEAGQGGSGPAPGAAGTGGSREVPSGTGGVGGLEPAQPGDPAMTPTSDAAVADPIMGSKHPDDGCGCRVGAQSSWGASPWWLASLLFGVRRRAFHGTDPRKDL